MKRSERDDQRLREDIEATKRMEHQKRVERAKIREEMYDREREREARAREEKERPAREQRVSSWIKKHYER